MVLEKFITQSPVDQFQIWGQFWNPWEKIIDWYFIKCTRMVAIWHKNERWKKWYWKSHNSVPSGPISIPRAVLESLGKIFDWYFMILTRMVAISHKNERLKKMVLEEVITGSPVDQFQIRGQFWNPWKKIFFQKNQSHFWETLVKCALLWALICGSLRNLLGGSHK